jgi:hypothetical protein
MVSQPEEKMWKEKETWIMEMKGEGKNGRRIRFQMETNSNPVTYVLDKMSPLLTLI